MIRRFTMLMTMLSLATLVCVVSADNEKGEGAKKVAEKGAEKGEGGKKPAEKGEGGEGGKEGGAKKLGDGVALLKSIDEQGKSIAIKRGKVNATLTLSDKLAVIIDGKPGKLSDLKPGATVAFKFNADKTAIVSLEAGEKIVLPMGAPEGKEAPAPKRPEGKEAPARKRPEGKEAPAPKRGEGNG